ncbi:MAG: lipoate--protein ligase [Oscillospiraceae bacterium]
MVYIENTSTDPYFNFGLEQYLMQENPAGDEMFLFWRTRPTLMIGNYQNAAAEINEPFARENNIDIVRRVSGGGTIYTDLDGWQFSFIVKDIGKNTGIDFKYYAEKIAAALCSLGANASFNSRNDILIEGKKISGNAQYRSKGYILHHGSLLFDTNLENLVRSITVSNEKIVQKGITSVRQRITNIRPHLTQNIDTLAFKQQMLDILLCAEDTQYTLTANDIERARQIGEEKFKSWDWCFGRSPSMDLVRGNRFEGGRIDFHLKLEKGKITACKICGDFFCAIDIALLENTLIGCPFHYTDMRVALLALQHPEMVYRISIDQMLATLCGDSQGNCSFSSALPKEA